MAGSLTLVRLDTLAERGRRRFLVAHVRTGGGAELERALADQGDGAAVLPYDAGRRTAILVRQPRTPPLLRGGGPPFLEALAGVIDDGETPEVAARREAGEETGLSLHTLEPVVRAWSSPGLLVERLSLFLAPYTATDRTGPGGGLAAEHEEIEVIELPLAELAALADHGEIVDLKTLALVQALRLRRPELFAG